ncbi:diacylglycerol kinase family protein [Corynebacterium choanae]|uniref:Diacylglycerol kinase n=1 Tax=Corynebacterium choanae TaxID=1862358 RepID=A0A3G6JAX7_9CORY|nr:diacylglycerol kinase family protein [Corynebacterium choanae]AZA14098.1 Diacylglycerol kinase [Corynebacterium choanae]
MNMPEYAIGYETIGFVAVVSTPTVGSGVVRHVTEEALARFEELGVDVDSYQGVDLADTQRIVRELVDADYDAIVVVGGDASINAVLQETAESSVPVGMIPAGISNDFARQFRLPTTPAAAADVIYEGFTTTVDLGKLSDAAGNVSYFGTAACTSFDPDNRPRLISRKLRRQLGATLAAFGEFMMLQPKTYRIEFSGLGEVPFIDETAREIRIARDGQYTPLDDGHLVLERAINFAAFGNMRHYAGGLLVCPRADTHDDALDVTIVENANKIGVLQAFLGFRSGSHLDYEFISTYRCKKATVSLVEDHEGTSQPAEVFADGALSLQLPVTIESVPAAARFIVPAP